MEARDLSLPPLPSQIEVVAFDAGGTLIELDVARIAERFAELGHALTPAQVHAAICAAKPRDAKDRPQPHAEGKAMLRRYLGIVLDLLREQGALDDCTEVESLVDALQQWLTTPEVSLTIWSHVPEGLERALEQIRQHHRLIVISNSDGQVAKRLEHVALAEQFEIIYDSAIVGYAKPDPRLFEHVLQELSLAPEQMVYIGDFYDIDIIGAARAGVHGVLLDPVGAWHEVSCSKARDMHHFAEILRSAR